MATGLFTHMLRWCARQIASIAGPSPYGHEPRHQPLYRNRQVDKDGIPVGLPPDPLPFDTVAWVSRHGLAERGVTCPKCSTLAVAPGNWAKVQMTARGEAVPCNTCKVLLFASPDDDHGDPKPGKPLDESVHYRFARPAGYVEAPKVKRISSAPIVDQTWVVIQTWVRSLNGRDYPLAGQEGRVIKIGDMAVVDSGIVPAALVAINGNEGLAGSHEIGGNLEWIPLSKLRAMILPTLRTSDPVRIISGQHKGVEGIVHASYLGEVHVAVEQGGYRVLIVPIEAVEKLEPLEITAVTKETDTTKDPAHV